MTTEQDARWAKVIARDKGADGTFWYAVTTTGVYCRPSCPSRTANPANVTLHDTLESARRTGFRPCRRCNPEGPSVDDGHGALVEHACRLIEGADAPPSLAELAAAVELSPGYFHRLFKARTGLTPRAYAAAHRARRMRDTLARGTDVTTAIHEAGFGSSSRFYEQADAMLGMTASRYRTGGDREAIRFAIAESSLGLILVASSAIGVASIMMGSDPSELTRQLQDRFPKALLIDGDAEYERLVATVVRFIEAPALGLDLPLDIRGTAFQQRVWQALRDIPAGHTASYAEIARRIGAPKAVRAVAGACAANRIAVAIPCHRVIRDDGALSGYRWGIGRKRELLQREESGPTRRNKE